MIIGIVNSWLFLLFDLNELFLQQKYNEYLQIIYDAFKIK